MLYATIIGSLGDHEGAIRSFEKALEIKPERTGAMCNIGHHLKTIGKQDESVAMYRHCIATEHDHAESYWSLANLKTFSFEVSEVEAMHTLLKDKSLADNSQAQIHNALGLHYESIKDYDSAFKHFEYCNLIARKQEKYDLVENEDIHDRTISLFTEDFFLSRDGNGCADPAPIFIVGLPRSGSTLIEQILASHSQVDGTHELGDLGRQVKKLQKGSKPGERFPETILDVAPEDWRRLGDGYLRTTAKFRGDAAYFIDKNPNNYSLIGILRLALPNARIVNARRHPLDSCYGSYKQLFASGQPFSYDLEEIGEYYLQYQRLMDHWHAVLPGYVLDVQYEHVVADLETQVRRILDFCGLPFEESCLNFHETERAVKTASSEQVRRPIYASSVNLWRNYEKHLGELVHVLEPLLQKLPVDEQPAEMQKS
jgi:tetratricopeptide (TPR) repeat protein